MVIASVSLFLVVPSDLRIPAMPGLAVSAGFSCERDHYDSADFVVADDGAMKLSFSRGFTARIHGLTLKFSWVTETRRAYCFT